MTKIRVNVSNEVVVDVIKVETDYQIIDSRCLAVDRTVRMVCKNSNTR